MINYGTVIDAQSVQVQGNSGVGALAGTISGYLLGLGSYDGYNPVWAIRCRVRGVAGNVVDKAINTQQVICYIIRPDDSSNNLLKP